MIQDQARRAQRDKVTAAILILPLLAVIGVEYFIDRQAAYVASLPPRPPPPPQPIDIYAGCIHYIKPLAVTGAINAPGSGVAYNEKYAILGYCPGRGSVILVGGAFADGKNFAWLPGETHPYGTTVLNQLPSLPKRLGPN